MHALPARNLRTAALAAVKQRNTRVIVTLLNGNSIEFQIEDVVEDALIGKRWGDPHAPAAIIPYHAILMLEFR